MKYMNEKSIDELKRLRKILYMINIMSLIVGIVYTLSAYYFYFRTGLVVLPLMLFITGIASLLVSAYPNNLSLMIYLKELEKEQEIDI